MNIYIITGHYGVGKTNVCVNMAMTLSTVDHAKVSVIDLDTVNPYFRTADFESLFGEHDIKLISSVYANSNLDTPAITFGIESIIKNSTNPKDSLIVDVGGDDTGAMALGQFAEMLSSYGENLKMFYVVNSYRYLTADPKDSLNLMRSIESASRLKHTGIINNSNLGVETTLTTVESSRPFAEILSKESGLPVVATCYPESAYGMVKTKDNFFIKRYVMPIWEQE
jgi:DhnA family fructose-bisphosphate aldolase class Ia